MSSAAAPKLGDIIDAPALQSLVDDFYQLVGIPMAVIDTDGNVLVGVGWQDICTKFHRVNPDTCRGCIESDTQLTTGIAPGEFRLYKCKNHMWDVATPVVVGDRHVGNVFSGQFFFDDEVVDYDEFREQARRHGFDEHDYLQALGRVPRLSRLNLDRALAFFVKLAHMLSRLGNLNATESVQRQQLRVAMETQRLLTEVLRILNRGGDLRTLVRDTLWQIRRDAGFDAVGLRLRDQDDCPYYEQTGFSDQFILEENFLCARNGEGDVVRDVAGRPVLECTCGVVASGRTDVGMDCFTNGGSFWTNASPELLKLLPEADPRVNPRNRCIHHGYQSVGLFPVRAGDDIVGVLQLNDRRPGRFTRESVSFYESVAQNIGLALRRATAEERLREANAELAEADKRKNEFIAILSHELRNPLAPIRFALPILQAQRMDDSGRRSISVVARQADHLTRLVDDLLDLSRITSGKIELRREHVTLNSVLLSAVEAASPAIADRRHVLKLSIPEEPIWLYADSARIAQVVTNLLDNSAKYTPHAGEIRLSAEFEIGGSAIIRVRDNGIGIPANAVPTVFDMFRQVQRADKPQGGLGIGLALVKKLVEMHNGTIEARSDGVGCGSEFVVRIPLAQDAASSARDTRARGEARNVDGGGLRVLVVDDNADLADMLAMLVEAAGHDVWKASDGRAAVSAAVSALPDVVLLDIGLPEMDGIAVARELRRHDSLARTRLVALTGWGQEEDKRRTAEAGFDYHVTKPADPQMLTDILAKIATERL